VYSVHASETCTHLDVLVHTCAPKRVSLAHRVACVVNGGLDGSVNNHSLRSALGGRSGESRPEGGAEGDGELDGDKKQESSGKTSYC